MLTAHMDDVKRNSFDELQRQWQALRGQTFSDCAGDAASSMTAERLAAFQPPCAAAVRAFFFCTLHVGSSFVGDGYLYNSLGQVTCEEWLAQNVPLALDGKAAAVAHVPARFVLPATAEAASTAFTSPLLNSRSVVRFRAKRATQSFPSAFGANTPGAAGAHACLCD